MESIVLKRFSNYFSAHILQTKLSEYGLRSYVQDENTVTITPFFSNAIGNIKVVVAEQDFPEASRLLKEFEEDERLNNLCRACNSGMMSFHTTETSRDGKDVVVFKCDQCGHETTASDEE